MNGIRVLRIIEYTYSNSEAAERDMANWTNRTPPNQQDVRMRSATMPFEAIVWEDQETP